MPLIFQRRIFRADLKANPEVCYIFGDNEQRFGLGGQAAEMRGEPNAIGVATLAAPGRFWREDEVERQCLVLDDDLAKVMAALDAGRVVVFPLDGVGTGLAALERHSPTTFAHLQRRIAELKQAGGAP